MKRVWLALSMLALTGCTAREVSELTVVRDRLRAERDHDAGIAEHLDEYKKEVALLQSDLERTRLWRSDGDQAKLLTAVSTASEGMLVSFSKAPDRGARLTVTGTRGRTGAADGLERIAAKAPGLALVSVQIGSEAWTGVLETRGRATLNGPSRRREPVVLPKEGTIQTPTVKRLRQDIAHLQREIDELSRLVGEIALFRAAMDDLKAETDALEKERDRLRNAHADVRAIFGLVLAEGSMTFTADSAKAEGTLLKGVTPATLPDRMRQSPCLDWQIVEVTATAAKLSRR